MVSMLSKLLLGCFVIRMSGLMVVLFGIRSLGYLPLVLVSLPISQRIAGVGRRWGHVDRVRPEGDLQSCSAFVLFLGLFSQFRGLRCGVSFWLCSHLMLCTWEVTIWVWFVMSGVCWMVVVVPFL